MTGDLIVPYGEAREYPLDVTISTAGGQTVNGWMLQIFHTVHISSECILIQGTKLRSQTLGITSPSVLCMITATSLLPGSVGLVGLNFKTMLITFKAIYGLGSSCICELIHFKESERYNVT